jgi:SAM-dependent methyltransferase
LDDLYTLLRRADADSVILDLGCGSGSFPYEACRGRIVAVDLLPSAPANSLPRVDYVRADSNAIPLRDASVDAVISHHTLEHFQDYKTTLAEVRRILRPQGWLWIAVPNGNALDDALYRFIFAGGGHVNRFAYDALVKEVESATETHLLRSCDLFSGFVYLRRPPEKLHHCGRAGFLSEIPPGFLTFSALALNTVTRLLDKAFGTRFSQYGWGFLFARRPLTVDPMPSYFNVCRQCGSGHDWEVLRPRSGGAVFGLGLYRCPNCKELNVMVRPPASLQ